MKAIAMLAATGLMFAACTPDAKTDSPVGDVDNREARIISMPDDFANISIKCDGTTGIYVTTRDAGVNFILILDDPKCDGDPERTQISGG